MKKLALGITGVGMACITGLGLAQPASAATYQAGNLVCETAYQQVDCWITVFSSQQVWTFNGYVNPNWNGMDEITFTCSPVGTIWNVTVSYVDGYGVSQTNHLGRYCTSTPPE